LLDDESGTATEDEEDVRARELRKQEVWLKVPPRNSDTDTGSETEVKQSQDYIDPAIIQESFITFESKVTSSSMSNMNTNDSDTSSERYALRGLLELSNEMPLTSNELPRRIYGQDNMTSVKNNASLNVISQVSENVICATDLMPLPMRNNIDNNISNQNESLIFLTNIALNHVNKEDDNSEYESFVDESIRLDLDGLDNKIENFSQNDIFDVNVKSLTSNSINFNINVNDLNTNNLLTNLLDLSINNLKGDATQNNRLDVSSEEVAKITVADTIPCIRTSKDSKVSDNETIFNADDLPSMIFSSLNGSKNSLSSSSSEIYQSIEMLHSGNSAISDHLNDSVEYSKSNSPKKIEMFKCENISVINQSDSSEFISKNRNVEFVDDSNNIHTNNVTNKKVDIQSITPMLTASALQESIYPIVTVTSPSPTQEIQFEELSLETSRLLVPLESQNISNIGNCDNAFDKLKHDLKQRKAKNKVIENGLRPLSTEYARLKMSKYFTENKKIVSKNSTQNEKAEDTSNIEMVKLHIKPKLSDKVNTEEMLKYFNNTSSLNSNKSKTSNIIAIKQNERRKLEIDIEEINDLSEKDIDQQFNQIEKQNTIAYLEADEMGSQCYLSEFEIRNDKEEICDSLDLICNDLIKLNPQLNINCIDSLMSNYNILKSENDRNISYLHADTNVDLDTNNFKSHTDMVSDISTLCTEVKNNTYFNITNDEKEQEKINPTGNVLNDNIDDTNKKKKDINLNSNMIGNDIIKEGNVIETDVQSNILNNTENEKRKANLMDLDETILNNNEEQANKINTPSDDIDKDNKSNKDLLFGSNIPLNAKLTASSLNNNADKCNRLYKSDTNLNKNTPRIFSKSIASKSLSELKTSICKDVSVEAIIIEKIVNTSTNIKNIITNDSAENVKEVLKKPGGKNLSCEISPFQRIPIEIHNLTISNTELSPPEIPARKKSAKRSFKHRSQAVEDIPKLQSQTVENISKLYNQNSNNVSNIKNQDVKDVSKSISRDVNDASKMYYQEKNPDINSMELIQRPARRNVAKLHSRDIANLTNLNKEIVKDVKDIMIAKNRNITDTSILQSQSKNVLLTQETYHHTNLLNKPDESIKYISSNGQSKKDKCIIS